jgi:hypothetical protein
VDLETGAVVPVTVEDTDLGDTTTLDVTLEATTANLETVAEGLKGQQAEEGKRPGRSHTWERVQHVIADKECHSAPVCDRLKQQWIQPVITEPKTGRRKW